MKKATVADWEDGRSTPTIVQVPVLCAVLGISYDTFFDHSQPKGKRRVQLCHRHRLKRPPEYYQYNWLPVTSNLVLRYNRERCRLSVAEVAMAVGVGEATLAKW